MHEHHRHTLNQWTNIIGLIQTLPFHPFKHAVVHTVFDVYLFLVIPSHSSSAMYSIVGSSNQSNSFTMFGWSSSLRSFASFRIASRSPEVRFRRSTTLTAAFTPSFLIADFTTEKAPVPNTSAVVRMPTNKLSSVYCLYLLTKASYTTVASKTIQSTE